MGPPQHLISDSGGAFTSNEVTAVLKRLQIEPNPYGEYPRRELQKSHGNALQYPAALVRLPILLDDDPSRV